VHYDIAADFAVLCSNCHRMIHELLEVVRHTLFQTEVWSLAQAGVEH
jgi:predicted HNH restriction endonuclease